MTKELSKAIMRRTKLQNQFLKKRTSEAKLKYNKQTNKYENHPSVIAIEKHMKGTNCPFSFQTVTKENIAKLKGTLMQI